MAHLLISGATEGHNYRDFPLQPERYSYVRALANAGYDACNFDRIGIGESDHPPVDQVTILSHLTTVVEHCRLAGGVKGSSSSTPLGLEARPFTESL